MTGKTPDKPDMDKPSLENKAAMPAATNTTAPSAKNEETEPMEVHHHAHHGGDRNWKSYFWEFTMLFLAVLCGFLAEYQLEHTIEKDREKQYIESMIADMREDSAKIESTLKFCQRQAAGFDSLISNIYQPPYTDSSIKRIYLLQLKYTHNRNAVAFTKRTITQLQNSGGLRLIRNKDASDSIIIYREECEQAEAQADYFEKTRMAKVNDYALRLFDNQYLFTDRGQLVSNFYDKSWQVALQSNDKQLLKEYANAITYARGSLRSYIYMLQSIQARIPSKLKFLEDKYH